MKRKKDKLVAEITDAFYCKAEKENLDPKVVESAVKDIQHILSNKKKKQKRCLICKD